MFELGWFGKPVCENFCIWIDKRIDRDLFKKILLVGILFSNTKIGFAMDFYEAYQMALEKDPTFQSGQAYVRSYDGLSDQAYQYILPTVSVVASRDTKNYNSYTTNGQPYNAGTQYTASLNQPLLDPSSWKGYRQAQVGLEKKNILDTQQRNDLMVRVVKAYFEVLLAREDLKAQALQKQLSQKQADLAQQQFEQGLLSEIDRKDSELKARQSHIAWLNAQNTLLLKQQSFRQIVGVPLEQKKTVSFDLPENLDVLFQGLGTDIRTAPTVESANIDYNTAVLETEKQRAKHLPVLSFSAGLTKGPYQAGEGVEEGNSRTYSLKLSIPIFSGFSVSGKIKEVKALEEKALYDLEAKKAEADLQRQQLELGTETAFFTAHQTQEQLDNKYNQLEYQKTAFDMGTKTELDVLYAQIQYQSALVDALKARSTLEQNRLSLEVLMGKATDSFLQKMSQRLFK